MLEWQKRRFREHWRRKRERGRPGRPCIDRDVRELIRRISRANPTWGSPRIVGELGRLGIVVAKSTNEKYRIRATGSPSPTWKAFLHSHVKDLVSIDFFIVSTVRFKILYVLIVFAHERRRIVHFNVTANPTAQWTVQQMVEASPFDTAPRYVIRDRDVTYGATFRRRVRSLDIEEVPQHQEVPGRTPTRRGSSGRCAASALTMSSSCTSFTCAGFCDATSTSTIGGGFTSPWRWTRLTIAPCSRPSSGTWSSSPTSAACSDTTNALPPDRAIPSLQGFLVG